MCKNCDTGEKPIAAIWWRQSTKDQSASNDTQINEARAMLEAEGYIIKYILGQDWHSLSILDAPKMQELLSLVRHAEIHAIGMYHGDRLAGNPAQKALILDLCERHGVKLLAKHSPIQEGPEGELIEYVRTWGKEQSVLRTQQASRDGLRDRVMLKGLPVNGKAPYGYRYEYRLEGDAKIPAGLVPDPSTYPAVCKIWKLALAGSTLRSICQSLYSDGIRSPRGNRGWDASSIHGMLKNPTYAGRFYALRFVGTEPVKRVKATYGKHTMKTRDFEDWKEIDFPIVDPPVTWEEYQEIQKRLEANKRLSKRRASRVYLLSGFLFCPTHGRRMSVTGRKKNSEKFYYRCSLKNTGSLGYSGCDGQIVQGNEAEKTVWQEVSVFLKNPDVFMAEMERRRGRVSGGEPEVQEYIKTLERKAAKVDNMETELVGLKLRGDVSDEAYKRQQALLRVERTHYQDEIERQRATLEAMNQSSKAIDAFITARARLVNQLDSASPEDRRWILTMLDTRVVPREGHLEISIGVPSQEAHNQGTDSVHITEVIP